MEETVESKVEAASLLSPKPVLALIIVLLALYALNFYQINGIYSTMTMQEAAAKEASKPAEVTITTIKAPDCEGCYDMKAALDQIRTLNIKVVKEGSIAPDSQEAKEIFNKYGIKKLPVFVITGEVDKESIKSSWSQMGAPYGELIDGAFVLTKQSLPFYDIEKGSIVGLAKSVLIIDASCPKCFDLSPLRDQLKKLGVGFSEEKNIDYGSQEAKELVSKFGIQRIPALLLSSDVTAYNGIQSGLQQAGANEKDGWYAMHAIQPPYRDVKSGELRGLITIVLLGDKSCAGCYDVNNHKPILPNFGIVVGEEQTIDISSAEGKELLKKYAITKVPTILMSPDVKDYASLNTVWGTVGSVEKDGWYVFRSAEVMGPYMDLQSGQLVTPQQISK